jgi:type I restriction-modification system DNA methylase subunit
MEYSNLSKYITNKLSKKTKKDNGIYFTPPSCVDKNIELLKPYFKNIKTILEPSCGSCEFIIALYSKFKKLKITGIEFNKEIYDEIVSINNNNINIINKNFLDYEGTKYDLIIGNPPFFVMKKNDVDKKYYNYFEGRPNIFILFIIKTLTLLNDNGILSFVLPKSFLNSFYYDKTRKYIYNNYQILELVECNDKYIETQQETIILIVRKQNDIDNSKFVLNKNNLTIFGCEENIKLINELYTGSTTLNEMNFNVGVGNVIWNENKDKLTDDETKTRLIYSSDIKNNNLILKKYSNKEKKNYIDKKGDNSMCLLINRGYGMGNYNFEYCLVKDMKYLIENHLIYIKYNNECSNDELIKLYEKVIKSLDNEKTKKFIKLYFGNNAINTKELNYILPIYS